jgi:hypothetical protein
MTFIRDNLPDAASYFESEGLTLTGPRSAKWKTTCCEFHGGSDSMRINTTTGAWVCMSCGEKGGDVLAHHMAAHGLEFIDAAKALGAWQDDGQPHTPQKPKPLPPGAALSVLAFECTLIAVAAGNIAHGVQLTTADLNRVLQAAGRVNSIKEAYQ